MVARVDYSALTERRCGRCRMVKPIAEFTTYTDARAPLGWRYYSRCIQCNRVDCRDYGQRSKPTRNARLSRWRRANPGKARAVDRRKRLKANYGLTEAQVEAMREAQGGRCLLCTEAKPLVIDHCHATGRVRGLLCTGCNTGLGWFESLKGAGGRIAQYLGAPCHADVLLDLANSPLQPIPSPPAAVTSGLQAKTEGGG